MAEVMRNVFKADILRVLKKKSFLLLSVIQILVMVAAAVIAKFFPGDDLNSAFKVGISIGVLPYTILIGIPVFLAVFSDDFRSHAMQVAIGRGTSRGRLIRCRFFEVVFVFCETALVFSVVIIALAIIITGSMKNGTDALSALWQGVVSAICWAAISMIFVYAMQKATMALVLYILMALGTVTAILASVSEMVPFLRDNHIHLDYCTVSTVLSRAVDTSDKLWVLMWVILVAAFIVLPLVITTLLFKKKELEF